MRFRKPFVEPAGAVVVITGASSGIGRATARRLASRGAKLVLAARGPDALAATAEELRAEGAEVAVVPTDVTDRRAVADLSRAAEDRFGRIDVWINDAGVMAYGAFDETPVPSHRRVVETNLLGPLYGSAEAVERFRRQGAGVLVNVASLYAEMTSPLVSSYVASKFGVLGLTRAIRRDLYAEGGIGVCCILPASIDTPIFRTAANYGGRRTRAIPPVSDPDRVARAIVRCIERPRREVRIGYVGRVMAMGEKVAGPVYDRVVGPAFRFLGFTGEEVPRDDGNLFEPTADWQQVDGEWRNTAARRIAVGVGAAAALAVAYAVSS